MKRDNLQPEIHIPADLYAKARTIEVISIQLVVSYQTSQPNLIFNQQTTNCVINAVASGSIELKSFDGNYITLYHNLGATKGHIWEWIIGTDSDYKHIVKVSRSLARREDFHIKVINGDSSKIYTSKNFSEWGEEYFEYGVGQASQIIIRTKIFTSSSSYYLRVLEDEAVIVIPVYVLVIIPTVVAILLWTAFWVLFYFWYRERLRFKRREAELVRLRSVRTKNQVERIIDVLDSMQHGLVTQVNVKYHQENWVVCLEGFNTLPPFDDSSYVHITHDCFHIFHTGCISEWFSNIDAMKEFTCPHCNTVQVWKEAQPYEENIELEEIEEKKVDSHEEEEENDENMLYTERHMRTDVRF